jgi:hypothetical protein
MPPFLTAGSQLKAYVVDTPSIAEDLFHNHAALSNAIHHYDRIEYADRELQNHATIHPALISQIAIAYGHPIAIHSKVFAIKTMDR